MPTLCRLYPFRAPADWADHLPPVRGRLLKAEVLASFTWFRVGGPADVLFLPADADDLAQFARGLHQTVPLHRPQRRLERAGPRWRR